MKGLFSYTKYFFTLSPTLHTLFFATSQKAKQPKGSFFIGRHVIDAHGPNRDPRKFIIHTPTHVIILLATSPEGRARWISALRGAAAKGSCLGRCAEGCAGECALPAVYAEQRSRAYLRQLRVRHAGALPERPLAHAPVQDELEFPGEKPRTQVDAYRTAPVARILIEKRYIISKPKPVDLVYEARQLSAKLDSRFPNQRNIVVYNFEPSPQKRGWNKRYIGYLDVHRSLDQTTPHFLAFAPPDPTANIHNTDTVDHPATAYALIKIQPFVRKLAILNNELKEKVPAEMRESYIINRVSVMQLAMLAILSDIADELSHFNKRGWCDGLTEKEIKKRMTTLTEFALFPFDSLKAIQGWREKASSVQGDVLIELYTHIEILTKSYVSIFDYLLPRRRRLHVASAAKKLAWNSLIGNMCDGPAPSSTPKTLIEKIVRERVVQKQTGWKLHCTKNKWYGYSVGKVDNKQLQMSYYYPPGLATGPCDTHTPTPTHLSFQQFVGFYVRNRTDEVVEGKYMVHSDKDRIRIIEKVQRDFHCPAGVESNFRTVVTPFTSPF